MLQITLLWWVLHTLRVHITCMYIAVTGCTLYSWIYTPVHVQILKIFRRNRTRYNSVLCVWRSPFGTNVVFVKSIVFFVNTRERLSTAQQPYSFKTLTIVQFWALKSQKITRNPPAEIRLHVHVQKTSVSPKLVTLNSRMPTLVKPMVLGLLVEKNWKRIKKHKIF